MKVAVFGDMHGNCFGLDAVLEELELEPVDQMVCLGDAMQGGVEPRRVMERLQQLDCPVVLGNSDAWLVSDESSENISDAQRSVGDWTREQIGTEGKELIASFPLTYEMELEGDRRMLCFHGSPLSFDDVLLPEIPAEEIKEMLGERNQNVLAGGHVHLQWTRTIGAQLIFNPGSAGAAYNRFMPLEKFYFYPASEYAVVYSEGSEVSVEFRRLLLDPERLAEAALATDHPFAEKESHRYQPKR